MNTVDSYFCDALINTDNVLRKRYLCLSYVITEDIINSITEQLVSGSTVVMYSCTHSKGWQLNSNTTYIEAKMFKSSGITFHNNTIFVEPAQPKILNLTLKSLRPNNLVIAHSDFWVGHRPLDQVIDDLEKLLIYVAPGGKIIFTCPVVHLNFNKLIFSIEDICCQTGAKLIGNSIILTKTKCQ